jgi:hypothetical protein
MIATCDAIGIDFGTIHLLSSCRHVSPYQEQKRALGRARLADLASPPYGVPLQSQSPAQAGTEQSRGYLIRMLSRTANFFESRCAHLCTRMRRLNQRLKGVSNTICRSSP